MKKAKVLWIVSLLVYTLVLFGAVFHRSVTTSGNANLDWFLCYREMLFDYSRSSVINVLGNILLFVPFGFLWSYPFCSSKRRWIVIILGAMFSGAIELLQFVTKLGIPDVDDCLNNTTGVVCGFSLFSGIQAIKKRRTLKAIACALVAVLPFLLFAISYELYQLRPYGNTQWDLTNGTSISLQSQTLQLCNESIPIYRAKSGDVETALSVAESIYSASGTSVGKDCTVYQDSVVIFDSSHQKCIWYNLRDCTYEYTDIPALNTVTAPSESGSQLDESDIRETLFGFGISIPGDAMFHGGENGSFSFQKSPHDVKDGPNSLIVEGRFQNGSPVQIHYATPSVEKIGSAEMLTDDAILQLAKEGKYYVEDTAFLRFSNLDFCVTSCRLLYALDTKGFYRPFYEVSVLASDRNFELYFSLI